MCSGRAPAPTAPGSLLSGSQGRGGWSGGCGQGAQPLPAGQERLLPGPGAADLQHPGAGVAGQPGGQAQQPVAQRARLCVLKVLAVVQAEQPAPASQVFEGRLYRPIALFVRTWSSTTACWRCSTSVNWGW